MGKSSNAQTLEEDFLSRQYGIGTIAAAIGCLRSKRAKLPDKDMAAVADAETGYPKRNCEALDKHVRELFGR